MKRKILPALAVLLASTTAAWPAPLLAAIPAFAALSPLALTLISAGVSLVAGVGASLIASAIRKNRQPEQSAPVRQGVQLDVEMGDTSPLAFTVGRYATAGTRKYINAYGDVDGTPNALLVDVIQLGDLSAPESVGNLLGFLANGERCTLGPPGLSGERSVLEYEVDGKPHMWVRYLDGTQTTADFFLSAVFGSDPERPWTSDMIGRGTPFAVVTTLVNRELFSGRMRYLFEPPVRAFYDLRQDSTNGGSGSQRWDDPSTWQPTENPAIIIYNLIRGVYYGAPGSGEWVFGGQNLPAFRLPAANWIAAANACDEAIPLAAGGTEPRFRCGYEVRVDQEPLAVIEELLKACSGRLSSSAGFFRLQIGVPSTAVYAFTDGDILVTEEQGYQPYPRMEAIHNAIEGAYPEPAEGWANKEAPPRYSSDLESRDGGRRLVASANFAAAPFAVQVQRLMTAAVEEARRFRTHEHWLPPDAAALQPGDLVSWSSQRNGYVEKKFLVVRKAGRRSLNQRVLIREVDPDDYDWSSDFEMPVSLGPLGAIRPPPLQMHGWSVAPATIKDNAGIDRRPAIEVSFKGDLDDVEAVHVLVREDFGGANVVFDGSLPYGAPDAALKSTLLTGNWTLPATDYEVQGEFVTRSGSRTEKSAWLGVTTPPVKLTSSDVEIVLDDIAEEVAESVEGMLRFVDPAEVRDLKEKLRRASLYSLEQDGANAVAEQEIRENLSLTAADITAAYESLVTLRVSELNGSINAVASRATTLELALTGYTGSNAVATAFSGQALQISANAGNITLVGNRVDSIDLALTGYSGANAVANAFSGQAASISSINGELILIGNWQDSIDLALTGYTGSNAVANAFTARDVSISAAQTTADGRNRVFRQGSAPTATAIGDLWIHTSENNRLYRASATGSGSWVLSEDQRIPALIDTTVAQGDALDLLEVGVGKFAASGLFRTQVVATHTGAQATVGISAAASDGGTTYTSAIVLNALSGGETEVGVVADRFFVAQNQWGSGRRGLFAIIGGVTYIDNAMIRELEAVNIKAGSLTGDRFVAGTITSGLLASDVVRITSSLQLDDGVVVTGKIPAGAITNSDYIDAATYSGTVASGDNTYVIMSGSITSESGQPIKVWARATHSRAVTNTGGAPADAIVVLMVQLLSGGTVIQSAIIDSWSVYMPASGSGTAILDGDANLFVVATAGTYTYRVVIRYVRGTGINFNATSGHTWAVAECNRR